MALRLLYFSLGLNAVLLLLYAVRIWTGTALPLSTERERLTAAGHTSTHRGAPARSPAPPAKPWSFVEQGDPATLISRLRAVGCPEATLQDIVAFRVASQYRERHLELLRQESVSWDWRKEASPGSISYRSLLAPEMDSDLEDLLGVPVAKLRARIFGFERGDGLDFPGGKNRLVRRIEQQFRQESGQILERSRRRPLTDAERSRWAELEETRRSSLAAVLTPEELERYRYRFSSAAEYVRRELPQAKSEAEFQAMVRVADDCGMRTGQHFNRDREPELARQSEEREKRFQERLRETLGQERLAEQAREEQARRDEMLRQEDEANWQLAQRRLESIGGEMGISTEAVGRFASRFREFLPTLERRQEELRKTLSSDQVDAILLEELHAMASETMGEQGPALFDRATKSTGE